MVNLLMKMILKIDAFFLERKERELSLYEEDYDTHGITVLPSENFWDGVE